MGVNSRYTPFFSHMTPKEGQMQIFSERFCRRLQQTCDATISEAHVEDALRAAILDIREEIGRFNDMINLDPSSAIVSVIPVLARLKVDDEHSTVKDELLLVLSMVLAHLLSVEIKEEEEVSPTH